MRPDLQEAQAGQVERQRKLQSGDVRIASQLTPDQQLAALKILVARAPHPQYVGNEAYRLWFLDAQRVLKGDS